MLSHKTLRHKELASLMGWWDGSYPLDCEAKNDPQEIRVGFSHNFAFFSRGLPLSNFLEGARRGLKTCGAARGKIGDET